jgi:hypothetical protein
MSEKLNLSKNTSAYIPDDPFFHDDSFNIVFQYRWMASASPQISHICSVIVFGDAAGLNSGNPEELGDPNYVNKAVIKITEHLKKKRPNAKLKKLGFSAYSGGGIAIYNLLKKKDKFAKFPDAFVLSDANYGGKATEPVWTGLAKDALDNKTKLVLLHTPSLGASFSSTTQTTKCMLKSLGLDYSPLKPESFPYWNVKPTKGVLNDNLIILSIDGSHGDAGRVVPHMWDTFLVDWDVDFIL